MLLKEFLESWGLLILSVFFNVYGIFVIKLKLNQYGIIRLDSWKHFIEYFLVLIRSPLVISGVILFFLAPFLFAIALSRMEIVVAYPAQLGLNFVFLVVLALLILGESLTVHKTIGMVLVLAGIYFLSKAG
jgi:multidrug transporter EmrE-like cation transporter